MQDQRFSIKNLDLLFSFKFNKKLNFSKLLLYFSMEFFFLKCDKFESHYLDIFNKFLKFNLSILMGFQIFFIFLPFLYN